jgi:hypothetical protein
VRRGKFVVVAISLAALLAWIAIEWAPRTNASFAKTRRDASGPSNARDDSDARTGRETDDVDALRRTERGTVASDALRVLVVDWSGAPVEGACIGRLAPAAPRDYETKPSPLEFADGATVCTDVAGIGELPLATTDAVVDVLVVAHRFVPASWNGGRAGETIRIELKPASVVTGTVRDTFGTPIGGARIRWSLGGERLLRGATTSDADGSYRLEDVAWTRPERGDEYWDVPVIDVEADGFGPLHFETWPEEPSGPEHSARFDVWMTRGATLRGRVRDGRDGSPIADAEVCVDLVDEDRTRFATLRTRSRADGRYELDGVPTWNVHQAVDFNCGACSATLGDLFAVAPGRGCGLRRISVPDEGQVLEEDLDLPPACSVHGRVVDERGAPLAGVEIGVMVGQGAVGWPSGKGLERAQFQPRTDGEGCYEVRDLPVPPRYASATFEPSSKIPPGVRAAHASVVVKLVAGGNLAAPDLVMRPYRGWVVHVVDEADRDVAYARLTRVNLTEQVPTDDAPVFGDSTGRAWLQEVNIVDGHESWYRFFVCVETDGYALALLHLPEEPGETKVVLHREHRLSGTVRDPRGAALEAEVYVLPKSEAQPGFLQKIQDAPWLDDDDLHLVQTQSDGSTGRFGVRRLTAGPWVVVASIGRVGEGADVQVVEVARESDEVAMVMDAPAPPRSDAAADDRWSHFEVALRFAGSERPVLRTEVDLCRPDCMHHGKPTAPGRFVFDHVAAGEWRLQVTTPGARPIDEPIVVAAGASELARDVDVGALVRGTIDLSGLPASREIDLVASAVDGSGTARTRPDRDGRFELSGLDAAKRYGWAVHFLVDDVERIRVAAGPPCTPRESGGDWRPRFIAAVRLEVDSGDAAWPKATHLELVDAAGELVDSQVVSNDDESKHAFEVAPGAYVVRLTPPEGAAQETSVDVAAGRKSVAIRLAPR